jgi:general secretion pathway protein D
MKHQLGDGLGKFILLLLGCSLGAAAHAQFFQQGQQQQGTRRTGASTREYPNNTDVGNAMISVDPETRQVVVVADEATMENISQVVSNLARPKPQVLIKVVFLEVTHNDSLDLGVEGAWVKDIGNSQTGNVAQLFGLSGLSLPGTNTIVNAFGQPLQAFTPAGAGLYTILGQDYQVTLRAIAQAGKLEILSRPSILARNNQQATISLGQQVPLITNTRFDTFGNQINTVTYQNVGVNLRVTPFITSEGMVEMILSPETSALAERSQWVPISSGAGGTISAPVINTRQADTVVVVPDGQTVIIGGLMANTKQVADSKIPILGDIPLLGALFRHRIRSGGKSELIIFLTPRIVHQPSQLAGLSADERAKSQLLPKSSSEQELKRFLDEIPQQPPSNGNSKSKKSKRQ